MGTVNDYKITEHISIFEYVTLKDDETNLWTLCSVTRGFKVTKYCDCAHYNENHAFNCELARLNTLDPVMEPKRLSDGIQLFNWAAASDLIEAKTFSDLTRSEKAKWIHTAGCFIEHWLKSKL